jgi:N-acetylglucosamine-6-phosphate deacetylase
VSQHIPTIVTNSEENIIKSIKAIVKARGESELISTAIPALHIEGPFISPREGARGVHNPLFIRTANIEEFKRWQEAAQGLIKIVTLSPEDEKAIEFIKYVSSTDVVVAIGHTDVSSILIEKAIDAGATLSTHLGNGSPGMIPRLENFIYKQLSDERMNISIIADGFHLPPFVIDCFTKCKGEDATILISDVAALAGSPPGLYEWNGMNIEMHEDGHMGLQGTSNLAGASLLLNTCVAHLAKSSSFAISMSVKCATVNPHRLLKSNVWDRNPIVGDKANFTLFSYDNENIHIEKTILETFVLFDKEKHNQ